LHKEVQSRERDRYERAIGNVVCLLEPKRGGEQVEETVAINVVAIRKDVLTILASTA
jgi:hypothetical protein